MVYQNGNKLAIVSLYSDPVSAWRLTHQPNSSAFRHLTREVQYWKVTKLSLIFMCWFRPSWHCRMVHVCCFVSYKHSYNVNPKNSLNAISTAISVTESWKHTYSSWGFGWRKSLLQKGKNMVISEIKGDKTFSFCFLSVSGEPIIAEKTKDKQNTHHHHH